MHIESRSIYTKVNSRYAESSHSKYALFLDRLIDWHDGTSRSKCKTAPGALNQLIDDIQFDEQIEGPAQYLFKVCIFVEEVCTLVSFL